MPARLDDLVMAMSTELLGVRAEGLEEALHHQLGALAGALDADRGYLLKTDVAGRSGGQVFQEWWAPGVAQVNTPIADLPQEAQRFWFRRLRAGEVVANQEVEDLGDRCPEAAEALAADGVRSILFVPLMAGDQPVGFLGFEWRRSTTTLVPELTSRVRTIGELIVSAVERCHADIDLAAASQRLAERNAELERSNRELQQFAMIVSHDLNQPLAVVQGFLDILRTRASDGAHADPEAVDYVDAARRAASRMGDLITDVLDLARSGAPVRVPEAVDLNETAAAVLDDLRAAIEASGARVEVDALPTVEGSPTQLRQLLQNLIGNALKFRLPDQKPTVRVSSTRRATSADLVVQDDGVGVPADLRTSVFDLFARGDHPDLGGSGIGLAVCARVVANHHGSIRLEETDGGGCTVIVTLPLVQPSPPDDLATAEPEGTPLP
ncbi:MAG: sensor histidine kinase [Acidimicrobiales bacterium]